MSPVHLWLTGGCRRCGWNEEDKIGRCTGVLSEPSGPEDRDRQREHRVQSTSTELPTAANSKEGEGDGDLTGALSWGALPSL